MTCMNVTLEGSGEIVLWDWILIGNSGKRIHAPRQWHDPHYEAYNEHAETMCGLVGWGSIPGIFTRMGAKRCARCCEAVGMPKGKGSPKNDDACRPIVEAQITAARRA